MASFDDVMVSRRWKEASHNELPDNTRLVVRYESDVLRGAIRRGRDGKLYMILFYAVDGGTTWWIEA